MCALIGHWYRRPSRLHAVRSGYLDGFHGVLKRGCPKSSGCRVGRGLRAAVLAVAWCLAPSPAAAVEHLDDLGRKVTLDAPAQRIVSLAPHITELLYAVGAGERIVAAVEYSDYPDAARRLPRVGNSSRIDLERLVMLQPDLVIAWGSGTPARELEGVQRLGYPLYLSEPRRLDALGGQMRAFGRLAGTEPAANAAAADYERRLDALLTRYADPPRQRVFYQLALQPLLTINRTHIINDLIDRCGGENVFAQASQLTPHVSVEAVVGAAPAVVVFALYPGESTAVTEAFWRRFGLAATTRFLAVPGDIIHRPTPRILDGLVQVCEGLAAAHSE